MKLYRGVRHPNGRCDVVVSQAGGEGWLREAGPGPHAHAKAYEWGNRSDAARRLAYDLVRDATGSALLAEELAEGIFDAWIAALAVDRWSFATWEIENWCRDELYVRLMEERGKPAKGGVPCPSVN